MLRSKAFAAVLAAMMFVALVPLHAQTPSAPSSDHKLTRTVTEYTLPPEELAKSTALHKTRIREWIVESAYGLALLLLYLYAGWAASFRDLAERVARNRFLQAWIVVPLFLVTLDILNLPPDMYGHQLSRSYGLSVQGWASWFGDWGKSIGIEVVGGTLLLWLLYLIIRWSPRRWWFYFWLATLPIMAFLVFIAPVVLDPMFNKFEPLDKNNPELVGKIEEVVHRAGMNIPRERIFEMKASAKTTELNAYVTGYGTTKRVVVWDTTEQKMTTPQTLFVFGHEMGHYVLGHVWKGMLFGAVVLFFTFYLGFRFSLWVIANFGERWHIRNVADWASLPALILVVSIVSFFVQPIGNGFSRVIEHHADIYGLEVTHGIVPDSNQAAAQSFQVLGETSLSYPYPNPFLTFWLATHPPIPDRVGFAVSYHPCAPGHQPRFVNDACESHGASVFSGH
jgi:Zn-dependent protease with chaperone function